MIAVCPAKSSNHGGSTGSSLAMVCAMKGYTFHPLSSDAFSAEKLDTMRAFGADLEIVQRDGGKVTAAWVASCSNRWAASMDSWG